MNDRESFEQIKQETNEALEEIEKVFPEAAKYLKENIIFDEDKFTIKYIGDKDEVCINEMREYFDD